MRSQRHQLHINSRVRPHHHHDACIRTPALGLAATGAIASSSNGKQRVWILKAGEVSQRAPSLFPSTAVALPPNEAMSAAVGWNVLASSKRYVMCAAALPRATWWSVSVKSACE